MPDVETSGRIQLKSVISNSCHPCEAVWTTATNSHDARTILHTQEWRSIIVSSKLPCLFFECTCKSTCNECGRCHNTLLHETTRKSESHSQQIPTSYQLSRNLPQPTRSPHATECVQSSVASVAYSSIVASLATTTCRIIPVIYIMRTRDRKKLILTHF